MSRSPVRDLQTTRCASSEFESPGPTHVRLGLYRYRGNLLAESNANAAEQSHVYRQAPVGLDGPLDALVPAATETGRRGQGLAEHVDSAERALHPHAEPIDRFEDVLRDLEEPLGIEEGCDRSWPEGIATRELRAEQYAQRRKSERKRLADPHPESLQ